VNEQQVRLSWLGNRRLALSLMPDALARAGSCRSILDN
jgi:hypothetical protein